jgi:hypothetical protein
MDKKSLGSFVDALPKRDELTKSQFIDYFVYFLTKDHDGAFASPSQVEGCFHTLDLQSYSNVSKYLSDKCKSRGNRKPLFVRSNKGYRLERSYRDQIELRLKKRKPTTKATIDLRQLIPRVKSQSEKEFLEEAIRCFENDAPRGAIVLTWILTLDHLYEYIVRHKLPDFNVALGKNMDKRVKVSVVASKDDFGDIPENKFIEFCRAARIISNDVKKILDTKLGIKNSSAHPSTIKVSETKAAEFVEDLVLNVIDKYTI